MRTVNKNIFQSSTCLTQDELICYHQNKMCESEKHLVEHHLNDCELCTDALEGIALLPDMSPVENANEKINAKYSAKPVEKNLFKSPKVWYAAASVVVLFVFGKVILSYFEENNKQVSENSAIQKIQNNSDQAVMKELSQQANLQETAIGDTVVKIVSSVSLKVADKSYEATKDYSNKRAGQLQPAIIPSTTNQLPHGMVVYKDEKVESAKEVVAAEIMGAPAEKNNDVPAADIATTKNISGYKIYNYDSEYKPAKKKKLVREGVPAVYESEKAMGKSSAANETESKEVSYDMFLSDAFADYKNKKYKSAMQKFNTILEQYSADVNALFYSALTLEEEKKYKEALRSLDKLDAQPNNVFDEESQWHRASIFIEQNETDKAKLLLQKIIDAKGFYAEQAKQKLIELK
jgi:tetratricopeptide (TPR) repeat protein